MGVKDVVHITREDEADIGLGRSGEGLDEPEQILVRAQAPDVEQESLARVEAMPAEDRPPFRGSSARGPKIGSGPSVMTRILGSARPSQSSIARREAWETVTIRSAQCAATASLSRQAIRPLSRGKTSSGWESGRVSCMVTTSLPTFQTGKKL